MLANNKEYQLNTQTKVFKVIMATWPEQIIKETYYQVGEIATAQHLIVSYCIQMKNPKGCIVI